MIERLRGREVAVDTLMAVGFFVLGLTQMLEPGDPAIADYQSQPDLVNALLIACYTLPLALRRVVPVWVFVIVFGATVVETGLDYPGTLARAGPLLAFHAIGTELSPRRSLRIGGSAVVAAVVWTGIGAAILDSVPAVAMLTQLVITGVPLHLGREVHRRRLRMTELEERAAAAEREREERARRAVADERARIARELHDVVAHQMTVMTLQADGASRIAADGDPRVAGALATIRDTGQHALTEMRRVVGVLRTADDDEPLAPMPRLADLDQLVSRITEAGVPVDVTVRGDVDRAAEGVQLSAFRVIQESLTNAVRHGGPGTSAHVTVTRDGDGLEVLVEDDGRGAAADVATAGGGHGLVGMRERVSVLGGTFEAGARPGGGFRVHATIPDEP